jgi:hypothetical protein
MRQTWKENLTMTSRDFCYWLQGYSEIAGQADVPMAITAEQAACIQKHLSMVFLHEIDPSMGDKEEQSKLDAIHNKPDAKLDPTLFYHPDNGDVKYRC